VRLQTVWIALSGGVDSVVLLHLLATRFSHLSLHAIHINHQLLPEAQQWENHCRKICKQLQVSLKIIRINIKRKAGESLEAIAREQRYAAFAKVMRKNDVIVTAHHQDDQAETVLLQLFRGAGLRGVSAMPTVSTFADGYLLRPLLTFTRDELHFYANTQQLKWIDDPSNLLQHFDRNFLRHCIFPLLKQRWPQLDRILARFAKHCAEQEKLLQLHASHDYLNCHGEYLNTLAISNLLRLSSTQQQHVLRYFFQQCHLPSPPEKLLRELQQSLLIAKADATPAVHWNTITFRRYRNHLFLANMPTASRQSHDKILLTTDELAWCKKHIPFRLSSPKVKIKFRHGGERFTPTGKKHSRPVKKLFQEWKIPPWQRDQIPLIYYNDQLYAIVGYAIGAMNAALND
jgi:tRNA(Ile)-lysidine synthase